MAWGYRLETLNGGAGSASSGHKHGRWCSVHGCGGEPRFLSAYRYVRSNGKAVTATRPLCIRHAQRFSMRYSLAWPTRMLRRVRRPAVIAWGLAAA
jgi:hypothetical protein